MIMDYLVSLGVLDYSHIHVQHINIHLAVLTLF